jgi:hypothetical protein
VESADFGTLYCCLQSLGSLGELATHFSLVFSLLHRKLRNNVYVNLHPGITVNIFERDFQVRTHTYIEN